MFQLEQYIYKRLFYNSNENWNVKLKGRIRGI